MGRISGVFGVKGWVKVYSFSDPVDNILNYKSWFLQKDGQWFERKLLEGRVHGKGIVARLQGCDSRDDAAALLETEIAVSRDKLPELEQDEFYWADLVGLKVVTLAGDELGTVSRLVPTGANDVLVVKESQNKERWIPYIRPDVVRNIDLDKNIIEVDWDPEF